MGLLVVESFENLKGPILVMLPVYTRVIVGDTPRQVCPSGLKDCVGSVSQRA
jgi:hypothetical protein